MNKKKSNHLQKEVNQQLCADLNVISMKEYQPRSEPLINPETRRLNQALALYFQSVLNTVSLVESYSRNYGEKQTIEFPLPNCSSIDFIYFYYWSKVRDEEDSFFIQIEYRDQYKDGTGLCAKSYAFTLNGKTTPQRQDTPAHYEFIDYSLSELNKVYPFYFTSFREFELEFYRDGEESAVNIFNNLRKPY